jgi:hypothetical protein
MISLSDGSRFRNAAGGLSAIEVYEQVYRARKIDLAALRVADQRLPVPDSDAARAKTVTDAVWRQSRLRPQRAVGSGSGPQPVAYQPGGTSM